MKILMETNDVVVRLRHSPGHSYFMEILTPMGSLLGRVEISKASYSSLVQEIEAKKCTCCHKEAVNTVVFITPFGEALKKVCSECVDKVVQAGEVFGWEAEVTPL